MADESTEVDTLRFFPCEAKDYNKARCRMDTGTMLDLGVIIGSSVRIRTNRCYVYCSVWPREGHARIIQFDGMVSIDIDITEKQASNTILSPTSIALTNISKLEPKEAISVTVSLTLKDIGDDCSYLSQKVLEKRRDRRVKMLLQGLVMAKGCVIKPRQLRNKKSSVYRDMYSVAIEDATPIINDGCGCVIVSANTTVLVKSVRMTNSLRDDNSFTMAGMDEAANMLREILKYPFEYPVSFAHLNLECPKGILLQGSPGVGKTLLVKNVTAVCNAQLITVNGTDVFGPHSGESEENLRNVFEKARMASRSGPCVLFIDEIDALCPKRGTGGSEEDNRIVAQLLTLVDGVESRGRLVVIGATNRPNAIDSALRRPGRFDREVVIGVPSPLNRLAILQAHTTNLHLDKDVDLGCLAEITVGYVGADLASLCREAALAAMKRTFQHEGCSGNSVKMADFQLAMCHIIPSTHRGLEGVVSFHPVSWQSIGGLQQVKQALIQAIEWPLKYPDAFLRLGLQRPRGVLLYGPPGCCKTTLVRAVASSCHCTFLSLSCAQLYSPYVGDAERMIREIFLKARATAPSILFLDELDSLTGKRSEKDGSGPQIRLLASLLNELDGIGVSANIYDSDLDRNKASHENDLTSSCDAQAESHIVDMKETSEESRDNYVTSKGLKENGESNEEQKQRLSKLQNVKDLILVAATNRPGAIDEALLRPGRIDRIIYVPPPDQDARMEILKVHTQASPVSDDVDLRKIAQKTEMFSGADLENLCREAALYTLEEKGMMASNIEQKHFTKALANVQPSVTKEQLSYYENW